MSILKALIGALVGAAIATGVLMFLRHGSLRGYEWFPLVTGLLTGLGVRVLTGNAGRSLVTGIVAALIAMVAILTGDEALEFLMLRNVDLGPVAGLEERIAQTEPAAGDSADDEGETEDAGADDGETEDSDEGEVDPEEEAARVKAQQDEAKARSSTASDSVIGDLPPAKRPSTPRDFLPYIFSGLGVLIAYQLGRGSGGAKTVASHEHHEDATTNSDHEEAT